jgi:hypothetical protein
MSSPTLQDDPSGEPLFNVVETETLALFGHLSFEFLEEFDVFAHLCRGEHVDMVFERFSSRPRRTAYSI